MKTDTDKLNDVREFVTAEIENSTALLEKAREDFRMAVEDGEPGSRRHYKNVEAAEQARNIALISVLCVSGPIVKTKSKRPTCSKLHGLASFIRSYYEKM